MNNYDYLYGKLAGPWMGTLFGEILVLGILLVLYSYLKSIFQADNGISRAELAKRLLLLGAVCLFVFYVALTYFLPYEGVSLASVVTQIHGLSKYDLFRSKLTLLALIPLDLLIIAILVGMFATLSLEEKHRNPEVSQTNRSLNQSILHLFLLTASFHGITVIWWLVIHVIGGVPFVFYDVMYHMLFVVLHLSGYAYWKKRFGRTPANRLALAYYLSLIGTVYVTRIWWYIDKL